MEVNMKRLKISENRRYFVRQDRTPFIWLADTAWTMPQRLKWDDVDYYMRKRKSQGFTVLQIVALDPEQDEKMRNPAGIPALHDDDVTRPNEAYFVYLDWILETAEQYGFYVLLLPAWGQLIVGDNWGGGVFAKTIREDNAYDYGRWIGNRYKNRENIIWCLGGDRHPIHRGVDYRNVWRQMAEGLAKGLTGRDLKYNEPDPIWQDLLITYHTCHEMETGLCSTFSYWTDEEAWISFIMLQSGHGLKPKNYELVKAEYDRAVTMPVWDGEPAYEMMPSSWPPSNIGLHNDWIVRKRAYWSLFAGSFGHTYGHSTVWCMISEKETDQIRQISWYRALDCPGAGQIKFLRDFLESRDLSSCVPAQDILLLQAQKTDDNQDEHNQACQQADGAFVCVYFPSGGRERLDLKALGTGPYAGWWFNPRDGKCYANAQTHTQKPMRMDGSKGILDVRSPTAGPHLDWVLVVERQRPDPVVPGRAQNYGEHTANAEVKKVFDW
jgi:hypothetical protein